MLDALVGQFMQSDAASEAVSAVTEKTELDADQARAAVQATAEGAAEASGGGGGGIGGAIGGMLGGGGGGIGGALGGMLGGGGGGGAASGIEGTVATFVAEKTGLSPSIAQSVVGVVLPKVMAHFKG